MFKYENLIRDALYNANINETKTEIKMQYAQGVLVGLVSALMAHGHSFEVSLQLLKTQSKKAKYLRFNINCLPETWREEWNKIK